MEIVIVLGKDLREVDGGVLMKEQMDKLSGYCWITVGMLWLTHTIAHLNYGALGTLAPFIKDELNLTSAQIGLFISATSIGSILVQLPAGVLTELVSIRKILSGSVLTIGLSAIILSRVSHFWGAILVLLIFGLAFGSINPAAAKTIMGLFPPAGRATAMGLKQTGVNMGGVLAGVLMPFLAVLFDWRNGFLMVGISEIVCAGIIYKFCRDPWEKMNDSPSPSSIFSKLRAMSFHKDILLAGGMGIFLITIQTCFSTYLVLFLTKELDFPILLAGTYFMIAFFCGAVGRVCWSALSDYFFHGRRKPVLFINSLFLVLICSLLGFVPLSSSKQWLILLLISTFGLTGIGWNAIWITMVGEILDRESSGLAVAEAFFIGTIGSFVGPPIFGHIVDATNSFAFAWKFLAISALAVIGLLGLFQEKTRVR